MAQIREFESTTESYFILDGVSYPKVYEAMLDSQYSDTKIKLVGTNRDTTPLVFSTQYTNIRVDGDSFDTALEAISRLNQIVFSKGGGSGGGGTTGDYQRNKQFFVPLPATVLEDWKGCIVFFTSSGNLTVPTGLTADFTFNGVVDNGVTLTPAITSPMAWLGTAPTAFSGVAIFTMVRRDGTNNFQILGV